MLLVRGHSVKGIADTLLMDTETIPIYLKHHKDGGVDELLQIRSARSENLRDQEQNRLH